MPTDTTHEATDAATADVTAALMDYYNPPPLPAAAPVVYRWADEMTQAQISQPVQAAYGG